MQAKILGPVASAGIALVASLGSSALAADASHGQVVAKRWCAACHVVSTDQRRGADNVPSFVDIAERPDFDAARLALFLLNPHPKMPNMSLTRREAEDITAYVAKLKK